jgi:hypothetical protein
MEADFWEVIFYYDKAGSLFPLTQIYLLILRKKFDVMDFYNAEAVIIF